MITVVVVGEGKTEQAFVRYVLAPSLLADSIQVESHLINTSDTARGGALDYQRVRRYLRNTLRQRNDTYVTTFFDLYGLPNNYPGVSEAQLKPSPLQKAEIIEGRFNDAVIDFAECRQDRFFAHIQPYEFETLLFADVESFISIEPGWQPWRPVLSAARADRESPEHINDGPETHPSACLKVLANPHYDKVRHGPIGANRITLARIEQECPHFAAWLQRLRNLQPL